MRRERWGILLRWGSNPTSQKHVRLAFENPEGFIPGTPRGGMVIDIVSRQGRTFTMEFGTTAEQCGPPFQTFTDLASFGLNRGFGGLQAKASNSKIVTKIEADLLVIH
jgi:hypothetical protein